MAFDTKRGQVLSAIVARLQTMTVAGGYHWTIKATSVKVDPENLLLVPETELPVLLVETMPNDEREFQPANELEDTFGVLITGRVTANGLTVDRKTQAGENLCGDLEKVLCVDITLGGLLFDLRVVKADPMMAGFGNNNNVIVMVELSCHQYRQHGAP